MGEGDNERLRTSVLKWCEPRQQQQQRTTANDETRDGAYGNGRVLEQRTLRLLEVNDNDVMEGLLKGTMVIRAAMGAKSGARSGGGGAAGKSGREECVVCTESKSFHLVQKEVSNTMLMIPPGGVRSRYLGKRRRKNQKQRTEMDTTCDTMDMDMDISRPERDENTLSDTKNHNSSSYEDESNLVATHRIGNIFELVRAKMDTDNLLRALRQRLYNTDYENVPDSHIRSEGRGGEGEGGREGYSLEELLQHASASRDEVTSYLQTCEEAIQIADAWYGLSQDIVVHGLEVLLLSCEEQGWALNDRAAPLIENDIIAVMSKADLGRGISVYLLKRFGTCIDGNLGLWVIDESKVVVFKAIVILQETPKIHLDEFISTWQFHCNSFTSKVELEVSLLRGECLSIPSPQGTVIHRFRSYDLPQEPALRFEKIFSFQPSWKWEDLQAYIRNIGAPDQTTESLLLKYTRKASGENGAIFFTKK